jgi:multidrug efflux pump subunit AcrA (membrane-fusion protein)
MLMIISGCNQNKSTIPVRKDIVEAVFASGNTITENHYIVTSQTEGYLDKSYLSEGDSVKAGQVLFKIENESQVEQLDNAFANYQYSKLNAISNSPVLEQLFAQKLQIENRLTIDSTNFIRHQNLINSGAVSRSEYEQAKLAYDNTKQDLISIENQIFDKTNLLQLELLKDKANLASQQSTSAYYEITSKLDGILLQVYKTEGELIKRGEHVSEIGSGYFLAKLLIVEEDIDKINIGQEVFIELNTHKGVSHKASISKIYPFFDSEEQSFIAEAKFAEPIKHLKSGTQLQANIKIRSKSNALVIPIEFLLEDNFVLLKDKQKVKLNIGITTSQWAEVLSGIDENSTLILLD